MTLKEKIFLVKNTNDLASAKAFLKANPKDKEMCLTICKNMISAIKYCDASLLDDREFILEIVTFWNSHGKGREGTSPLEYISERLRDDREIAAECLKIHPKDFKYCSARLRADEELAYEACIIYVDMLAYISDELKDNRDFALRVWRNTKNHYNTPKIKYFSKRLQDDFEVALAYAEDFRNVEFLSERLRDDENFFLALSHGYGIRYASEDIRTNRARMRKLCKKFPAAVAYASEEIKDDEAFFLEIADGKTILSKEASPRLKNDPKFALKMIEKGAARLSEFSDEIKDNEEVVRAFVCQSGDHLANASIRLKGKKELALLAYEHGGISLYYLEDAVRADREVILKAVEYDGEQMTYIPSSFRVDPLIVYTALNGHFPYSEYWRADDWDGNFSHNVFSFVGEELKKDTAFTNNVIESFLYTEKGGEYKKSDFSETPEKIYQIMEKLSKEYVFGEDDKPKEKLDFTKVIEELKRLDKS